jgi:hypothetical protein
MDLTFVEHEGGAPLATQLDGEEWPAHHRVQIEVKKQGLRLIIPGA